MRKKREADPAVSHFYLFFVGGISVFLSLATSIVSCWVHYNRLYRMYDSIDVARECAFCSCLLVERRASDYYWGHLFRDIVSGEMSIDIDLVCMFLIATNFIFVSFFEFISTLVSLSEFSCRCFIINLIRDISNMKRKK